MTGHNDNTVHDPSRSLVAAWQILPFGAATGSFWWNVALVL
jgi:hypothetical protein